MNHFDCHSPIVIVAGVTQIFLQIIVFEKSIFLPFLLLVGQDDQIQSISAMHHNKPLALNMLNYFKNYKRCIYIFDCILDLAWPKEMKLTVT